MEAEKGKCKWEEKNKMEVESSNLESGGGQKWKCESEAGRGEEEMKVDRRKQKLEAGSRPSRWKHEVEAGSVM